MAQPIRMTCSFGRLMRTESKSVHNVLQKNENTMSNKNFMLYNYIRESNSNKHFLLLPDVYNYWLKVPQDTLQVIREALDYVLQGVLLLDDMQDGTQFRRNLPSAHRVYGAPWAANASMFCFMAAFEKITRLRSPEAVDVYCEQMMAALDGIALDVYWRDTFLGPTEDEYIEMVKMNDVQDGTQFRRNLPSAHRIYGTPWAANASTFCFMAALKKIADLGNPEAVDNFCQEMMSALDGIALDLYWRDAFICPTENEYMEMVKLKNSFFTLNLGIIQSFSKDRRTYSDLMNTYGVYYQIRDEYANLVNVKGLDTKSHEQEFKNLHEVMFCEDITEGRFTFPMIHGLNSSEGPTIRSILVQRTSDSRIKQHCLSLLEKVGSLDYTRRTLHDLDADLREQIHQLGGNPVFLAYLDELSNWK